jgi:hypothetical protein
MSTCEVTFVTSICNRNQKMRINFLIILGMVDENSSAPILTLDILKGDFN